MTRALLMFVVTTTAVHAQQFQAGPPSVGPIPIGP